MQHAIAVTSPSQETLHAAARPRQSRITALALAVALLATLLPGITAASSGASIEIHQSGNRIVRDHHRTASRAPAGTPAEAPASAADPAPAAGGTVDAQPATAPDEPTASPEPAATPSPGTNPAEPAVEPAGAAFPFSWKFPTRKPPSFNPATAGGFVTIRFSLGGNRGMGILASPSPTSQRFDCASGALIPHSRYKTRPFGSAGLSYNASAKVYTYTWQTREEWSNSCRRFELALSDGTVHRVKFRIDTFNFIPPILHLPATNPAVAGSVVDVGFHMGASAGAHVIRSNTPRSARVNCGSGALMGPWERTLPHGSAGLTRNPSTHDYHYAWQTDAGWTGTCRRFEMKMRDGSLEVLRFQFNRPPHAVNDSGSGFGTDEASPFTTASVLANDSDPDGDSFSVTGMSAAGTHGSVTNNGDGTFGYSPNGQFEYLASGEHASDTFSYTITDAHGASDTATVTINVDGLNDAPVVANQTRSIAENSANGSNVGVPVAFSDVDTTDGHTFAITAGNGSGAFAINSSTGQITVADASQLDHEATPSYSLTVEVTDDGSPSLSDSATITVNVTDVNEAPVVDAHTFSLAENSANGTSVGTATYSDPDSGQTHIFSITAGNGTGGGAFAIDSSTGAITVNDSAQLDYETTPSFSLTVKVLDNGSPAKFGTNTITVNLTDANDAPVVGAATKSIAENTANGTNVGTPVTNTDQDSPAQGHTFSITGGNGTGGGAFAIDGTTGQLSVNDSAQLDYETVSGHHFLLTVRVTDDGSPGKFGEATVTVNLTNVNDAPVVPDASKSVAEDATNGTNVGSPVAYTDQDAGQTHTFAITAGNTNSAFAINASTGQITVADAGELDHEATPSYSLTIQVTDNGSPGLAGSGTITVNVTDVNEAPVVDAHTFSLAENSANGTAVGTATYTDPDSGQTHTFSITAGNGTGGGAFAINSSTGAITVNDASQLDYETTPSFGLTVKVLDNGSPAKFGTNTITVNLTDANDAPVVGAATKSIAENSANGTNVGTPVTYTDQDSPARGHTFSITGGNGTGGGAFAIDGTTGQLSVNDSAQLDYETTPSFSLTVRVTDDGSPVKFGEATVTVNLTNVNDAPVITLPSSVGAIPMTDSSVNGVSVSDADAGSLDIELVLAVDHGTLTVDETVGGGVVAADVSGNGT
ncbi:MAG: protocadherin Fat 4, partial [Chloroflexota bacterium]|nr:protocadherin Fat 4 [Chloroflexota bacterium]